MINPDINRCNIFDFTAFKKNRFNFKLCKNSFSDRNENWLKNLFDYFYKNIVPYEIIHIQ